MEEQIEKESKVLEWTAPEFIEYSRSWKWFLAAGLLLLAVIAYSAYSRDWSMVFIAVGVGIALYFNQKRTPKEVHYKISAEGLTVGEKTYPFTSLHSFWLTINDNQRLLNVIFINKFVPVLSILFYGIDPLEIKAILSKHIPEQVDRTETLADKLLRILKI